MAAARRRRARPAAGAKGGESEADAGARRLGGCGTAAGGLGDAAVETAGIEDRGRGRFVEGGGNWGRCRGLNADNGEGTTGGAVGVEVDGCVYAEGVGGGDGATTSRETAGGGLHVGANTTAAPNSSFISRTCA